MKTQDDEIKRLIDESYAQIEVPEGLEKRLSDKIDLWASEEEKIPQPPKQIRFTRTFWVRSLSMAASLILLITGSLLITSKEEPQTILVADTCTSVEDAYKETYMALSQISKAFDKGIEKAKESTDNISKTVSTANKYIAITDK